MDSLSTWPGLTALAESLGEQGFDCSHQTVANNLDAMGMENPSRQQKSSLGLAGHQHPPAVESASELAAFDSISNVIP